jgi:hypothetical protein
VDEVAAPTAAAQLYSNRAQCCLRLREGMRRTNPPATASQPRSSSPTTAAPLLLVAALQDACCAVELAPQWGKGWYRRACVRLEAEEWEQALCDAQQAQALAPGADAEALISLLGARVQQRAQQEGKGVTTAASHAAKVTALPPSAPVPRSPAELVVAVSGGLVSMHSTEAAGRELVAARDLSAGSDVFEEVSYVHVHAYPQQEAGEGGEARHTCAGCCMPLLAQPSRWFCRRCPCVAYCSVACRDGDEHHVPGGPECGVQWPHPNTLLALRLVRKVGRLGSDGGGKATAEVASAATEGATEGEVAGAAAAVDGGRSTAALLASSASPAATAVMESLEAHTAQQPPKELVTMIYEVVLACEVWGRAQARAAVPERGRDGELIPVAPAQLLHAMCQARINCFALVPPLEFGPDARRGAAMYAVASLFNHSCQPNVSVFFQVGQARGSILCCGVAALCCVLELLTSSLQTSMQLLMRDCGAVTNA